jgi:exosortase
MVTKPISAGEHAPAQSQSFRIGQLTILGFALVCVAPIFIAWDAMRLVAALALTNDTYTHIPLIPLVTCFLIYTNRRAIAAQVSKQWQWGLLLLVPGFLAVVAVRLDLAHLQPSNDLSLAVLGVILVWMGAFAFFFGYSAFRAARFALLFLIFTVPIPEPLLSESIYLLQVGSARAAATLFSLFGIPYLQNGLVFSLPGVAIRVAEECSGIRSTLALLIMTVLASHMFLKATWKQILVCLLAVPLSIAKNGLRIAALSALAIYVNPGFLYGKLHEYGGMFFFAAAFVPLALLFVILERGDSKQTESR